MKAQSHWTVVSLWIVEKEKKHWLCWIEAVGETNIRDGAGVNMITLSITIEIGGFEICLYKTKSFWVHQKESLGFGGISLMFLYFQYEWFLSSLFMLPN